KRIAQAPGNSYSRLPAFVAPETADDLSFLYQKTKEASGPQPLSAPGRSRSSTTPYATGGSFMTTPVRSSVDRATFENLYAGKAPWDIGRPQGPFVAVADQVTGRVLDAGCGTGEHALFFAAWGCRVTGIDFLEEVIRRAQAKAAERGLAVDFLVKDALTLGDWGQRFATVIDSGLFHVFSDDDPRRYVGGLAHAVEPGGLLFLMCFSHE